MIKTNIKMRVTPEQSAKVQEICFENGIEWMTEKSRATQYISEPFLVIDECIFYMEEGDEEYFLKKENEEIDPELFIRTNGTCIEKREAKMKYNDKMESLKEWEDTIDIYRKPIQYQIGIDTFQRAKANLTKDELIACIKFNIDKYNWRKKGQDTEDFKKIIDYANFAIEVLKGDK